MLYLRSASGEPKPRSLQMIDFPIIKICPPASESFLPQVQWIPLTSPLTLYVTWFTPLHHPVDSPLNVVQGIWFLVLRGAYNWVELLTKSHHTEQQCAHPALISFPSWEHWFWIIASARLLAHLPQEEKLPTNKGLIPSQLKSYRASYPYAHIHGTASCTVGADCVFIDDKPEAQKG